jgi:hypothetical protein
LGELEAARDGRGRASGRTLTRVRSALVDAAPGSVIDGEASQTRMNAPR